MKKKVSYFILIVFIILLNGCIPKDGNEQEYIKKTAQINLKDSLIEETVKLYIKEYELDPKKSLINIHISVVGQTIIDITYSINNFSTNSDIPSFYTFIDDFLVLIYSDIDSFKDQSQVLIELEGEIKSRHMVLENHIRMFDPPIWEILKCHNKVEIIKDNFDPYKRNFELNYLPCGYKLKIDTLNNNGLILVKDSVITK